MNQAKTILEARSLFLCRGPGADKGEVLRETSLSLHSGEVVLLRGASGCGKSSLLWALARMIPLDRGELLLQGRPHHQWLPTQWRTRVALLLQTHHMVPGTVEENLLFPWTLKIRRSSDGPGLGAEKADSSGLGAEKPDAPRLRTALDGAGLEEVALTADAGKLSVGQTARLSFIRTLLTRPDCLLLDEPFAALDPETRATIRERILAFAAEGGAVLLVAHDETLSMGSRTLRLDQGRLSEESS